MSDSKSVEGIGGGDSASRAKAAERAMQQLESRIQERRDEAPQERVPPPVPAPEPSPAFRPYRVMLDPETRRLFTEVIDPRTGNVMLRIPPAYDELSKEAEAAATAQAPAKEIKL